MYMVQIWKQELTNIKYTEAQDQNYKLPAIIPIVLYNGAKEWDAVMRFKDMLNESDRFGNYLVDFQYILINVNYYNEKDLLKVANAISCIIMMDQSIVSKDKELMLRRLKKIVKMKDKLAPEKLERIIEWLIEVFSKRFSKSKTEIKDLIESLKEGKDMTYAIERLFENEAKKAKLEGKQEGKLEGKLEEKIEIAKVGLSEGLSVELIRKLTGLDLEKIEELKKETKH